MTETNEIERAAQEAAAAGAVKHSNPWFDIFDDPTFTPVGAARAYPQRDGSETQALANVYLPFKTINAVIGGTIKMRFWPGRPKMGVIAEVTFPRDVLKALDGASDDLTVDYLRWIGDRYAEQHKGKTFTAGRSRTAVTLTGVAVPNASE